MFQDRVDATGDLGLAVAVERQLGQVGDARPLPLDIEAQLADPGLDLGDWTATAVYCSRTKACTSWTGKDRTIRPSRSS